MSVAFPIPLTSDEIEALVVRNMFLLKVLWLMLLFAVVFVGSRSFAQTPSSFAQISRLFASEPTGHLIIVGGGDTPISVQERFVSLAGGSEKAKIAVFPMATLKSDEEAREVVDDLKKFGAESQIVNIGKNDVNSESTVEHLLGFTGYWFTGGDQSRLADLLLGTKALESIERRYREGAVIGGTSAGASVMSSVMLTGKLRKPRNSEEEELVNIARGMQEVVKGFSIFKGAIVDQHFMNRARYNRLISTVLDHPELVGVGIDEETALLVHANGLWEVLGNNYVKIFDARKSRIIDDVGSMAKASDIRMHVLPKGSTFDLKKRKVTF
ncbi:MAG: cyanophycinase, partial [Rhodocyclaceae bacterium]|nr:cyanophycinase [Rhodocyclaceae bacterium]